MNDLIAYCGLDCEKCDARIATVNDDHALREATARLWAEANEAPITPEMIDCLGCRVEGVKTPYCDSMCEIRQCAMSKGVATCGDCEAMDSCEPLGYVFANSEDALDNLKNMLR